MIIMTNIEVAFAIFCLSLPSIALLVKHAHDHGLRSIFTGTRFSPPTPRRSWHSRARGIPPSEVGPSASEILYRQMSGEDVTSFGAMPHMDMAILTASSSIGDLGEERHTHPLPEMPRVAVSEKMGGLNASGRDEDGKGVQ